VRLTNLAAQALYARHGFRSAGQRRNYYTDPTEDALVMSAALEDRA
jgi:ribosomal-protein-alanine N-acetyltransferase